MQRPRPTHKAMIATLQGSQINQLEILGGGISFIILMPSGRSKKFAGTFISVAVLSLMPSVFTFFTVLSIPKKAPLILLINVKGYQGIAGYAFVVYTQ
jgi:hypothetical protein